MLLAKGQRMQMQLQLQQHQQQQHHHRFGEYANQPSAATAAAATKGSN